MLICSLAVRPRGALAVPLALMATTTQTTLAGTTDPWADSVVSASLGAGGDANYTDPNSALGEPSRFTGDNAPFPGFDSAVTPFNPAFNIDQLVSLGEGGSITLEFDEPIVNDPLNPFGVDLLVFGNAGYIDVDFPNGVVGPGSPMFGEGAGAIEVSQDGVNYFPVGASADTAFPTLGYTDLPSAFETLPGSVFTDFTKAVDPSLDPSGLDWAGLVGAYNGSGGGAGIDLSTAGLSEARFVRISNPIGSGVTVEIDAVADASVPAPGALMVVVPGVCASAARRRRAA